MKAIIPAAGHGTRFLPVTRVVPKEMLPIGARPALEVIVDEARAAGADEIVLVISPGKELIREYFKDRPYISFACQTEQKGLGHAVMVGLEEGRRKKEEGRSVELATNEEGRRKKEEGRSVELATNEEGRRKKEEGNVLILLGDALVAGCCAAKEMVALSAANGGCGVIGCERVPKERLSRYGVLKLDGGRVVDLVEKPSPDEAPSDIAIAGRYLLPAAILGYLKTQAPGKGGEIQLTDAIRRMVQESSSPGPSPLLPSSFSLLPYIYPGRRQDIGNPAGYLAALEAMGANI